MNSTPTTVVPLESIICTEELNGRPSRPPNYETENRALISLAQALADSPSTILQAMAEKMLEVFQCDSAGFSLLTHDEKRFVWAAIAGAWQPHQGGGTPRDFGPCGDVLDCNAPLLFRHWERRYPHLLAATPAAEEGLLVPFYVEGRAVGTIWAIAHDECRKFDSEDLRMLVSLGTFASAAYQAVEQVRSLADAQARQQTDKSMRDVNEALLVSSVRQHELAEQAQQAEALVRASEERYRALFDLGPVAVYSCDASGTIREFNRRAAELWGREPALGDTDERFCGSFKLFRPDGSILPHDQCPMAEVLSGKIAVICDAEVLIERPDGSRITVVVNIRSLKNGRGENTGAINCFYDITERKWAEIKLHESDELNRSLIDSSPDCIKVLDLAGNLLSIQCGLDLLGIEDIGPYLNTSWIDFWHDEDRVAARAAVELAGNLSGGGAANFVGFFRTLRGEPKWWDVSISPILNAGGRPEQLLAVSRDVTNRKRTEMNLAFFASINRDLARFTDGDDMIRTVGAKIGAYLDLSLCAFCEVDEAADEAVVTHDWHRDDVPGLVGVYRLADFVTEAFLRDARAGETIVVRDTATDPRTTPENFAALKIASFLCAPLLRDGRWRFSLSLNRSEASDWREDEIEIARELTARIWTRLEQLRAEDALLASQLRLHHAANAAGLTYVEIDLASGVARTAENYEAVMGYAPPPEQKTDVTVGTRLMLEHVVPHDRPSVEAALRDFTGGHDVGKIEYRVLGDDRIERYIESEWFVEFDPNGEPLKTFATNLDITERKRAEEKFRSLLESAPDAMVIIAGDGRITLINAQTEKLFGYARRELIGQSVEILIPQRFRDRHSGHRHDFLDDPQLRPMGVGRELWAARRDGSEFPIDISLSPLETESGTLVTAAIRDITDRKRADVLLQQNHDTFYHLIENSPFGLYIVDAQLRMMKVSAAAQNVFRNIHPLIGRDFEEIMTILWPEEFVRMAIGRFRHTLDTGEPFAMPNFSEQRQDMTAIESYDWKIERITLPDGQFGVVCYFYDITERKLAEVKLQEQTEALADLHRRKDEFLAMLSHELRSPLAPIANAVHLLRLQSDEDSLQKQARGVIERQVGQLTRLVDDLMEVSRITTGRVHLSKERIVIGGIIERSVETAFPMMEQRRHTLTVSVPPEPIWLDADAGRLEQVIVNLLTNAAKYTEENGCIWLSVEASGERKLPDVQTECIIRIRDTGVGIAPGLLPRVFDLFTQAERSLDRSQGGLGIGLALVQRLVEMHGGTVEVTSTLGKGSEFIVRLPISKEEMRGMKVEPNGNSSFIPHSSSLKVLIVDDNDDSAETLAMLLKALKHDVRTANDGLAALEAASNYRPDVVLLDIGLPTMDGYEVAAKMRLSPAHKATVLVALTGYGQDSDRQKSKDAGFDHHLVKPADFAKLQQILTRASERAKH